MGLGMVGVFLAAIASVFFPPRILDGRWQLAVATTLVDNGVIPLVGLAFFHFAVVLDPASPRLRSLRLLATRLAIPAFLGFLLLIPLQLRATGSILGTARVERARQQEQTGARFDAMRQAIAAATRPEELRSRLLALKGPSLGPADLGEPLPQLKRRLLLSLNQAETVVMQQLEGSGSRPQDGLVRLNGRVILSALALALAFAAGARRAGSEVSLLAELAGRRGRRGGIFPFLPAGRRSRPVDGSYFQQIGGDDGPPPPAS
ncbi:HpsJ family protein [Cyanobium sp. N5-Cardenillas]|uniref:HpsJ family protein n=1 Tax=Cyanobium sp. N5-Cardenillas TaxID=2823720 RepID=UPI0020CC5433|nr:HpsJ family protein [Cyanobium sp. N5-Cardenillas]